MPDMGGINYNLSVTGAVKLWGRFRIVYSGCLLAISLPEIFRQFFFLSKAIQQYYSAHWSVNNDFKYPILMISRSVTMDIQFTLAA